MILVSVLGRGGKAGRRQDLAPNAESRRPRVAFSCGVIRTGDRLAALPLVCR